VEGARALRPWILLAALLGGEAARAHSPHDVIDAIALSPAFDRDQTLFVAITDHLRRSTDGGYSWKELTNGLDHKHPLKDVKISPAFEADGTVLVCADGDGAYRSRDRGASWQKVCRGLGSLRLSRLAVSPAGAEAPVVLAAGTEGGLWSLAAEGEAWVEELGAEVVVTALGFFPQGGAGAAAAAAAAGAAAGGEALAADRAGGLRRRTGGAWSLVSTLPGGGAARAIAFTPEGDVFLGTTRGDVLRSADRGRTLETVVAGLSAESGRSRAHRSDIISLAASPAFARDRMVLATAWREAVFRSEDGGRSWKKHDDGISTDRQADDAEYFSPHFRDVVFSGAFAADGVAFAGGFDGLFKSADRGRTWAQLETLPVGLIRSLAVSRSGDGAIAAALGTYGGGGYVTEDLGASWIIANRGLKRTRLADVVFSPSYASDRTLIAGASNSVLRSEDGGRTWLKTEIRKGAAPRRVSYTLRPGLNVWSVRRLQHEELLEPYPTRMALSPEFARDETIFFGTRWHGLWRSRDRGMTCARIWDTGGDGVTDVALSPAFAADRMVFASVRGRGVHRSLDGGETWKPANAGLDFVSGWEVRGDSATTKREVLLEVSPGFAGDRTVFAGSSEGLYRSADAGASWRRLSDAAWGEGPYIVGLGLSPAFEKDRTLLVSARGRGFFQSEDGGESFAVIASELREANETIEFIGFSPAFAEDGIVFAASDEEVFLSRDRGGSWERLPRPVRYEDHREVVHYTGGWSLERGGDYSASGASFAAASGSTCELSFVGTGVSWIGAMGKDHGIARVLIDGAERCEVDQFGAEEETVVEVLSVSGLARGAHTLRLEVLGRASAPSGGTRVAVDAFDVSP
jgi:photosystem II stability/assembly factor-like uncharacterized protein